MLHKNMSDQIMENELSSCVALMGEVRDVYKFLIVKPHGNRSFWILGIDERIILKWIKEIGCQ
jgi:hypothetical protein